VKLDAKGLPYLTGTYIAYLITSNAGLTATLTHVCLTSLEAQDHEGCFTDIP